MIDAADGGTPPLVHGMGKELTEPTLRPLTSEEAARVLAHYPQAAAESRGSAASVQVLWSSPRPMSAAALVEFAGSAVFVKRHDLRVRSQADLLCEHAFISHLRAHGQPIPEVLATASGSTVCLEGDSLYEVHSPLSGLDLYRDSLSWSPYGSAGHARSAGAALARLHVAARDFPLPRRSLGVLQSSMVVSAASDPVEKLAEVSTRRAALAAELSSRRSAEDLERHLSGPLQRCAAVLSSLPTQWTHGDWHPSNLAWSTASSEATVTGIFDLGLSNRTAAVHDLAVAIERSSIDWLDLNERGAISVDTAGLDALIEGYREIRPLESLEWEALALALPVCHVEYALSEIEYFSDIAREPHNTELAYEYLVGHAAWFESTTGQALLDHLRGLE